MEITFTLSPNESEIAILYNGLVEFNSIHLPELDEKKFGLFLKNENGIIVGGLVGKLLYSIIHINYFWLSETIRFKQLGTKLIHRLELEAKNHDISNIYLETYSFQAPIFYTKLGYVEIGRYSNYPKPGIDKIIFQKYLSK